ncbi:MAG: hypothetical protein SFV54_28220 [Bryobacteraceae bacterium]|nr:hypothetical protein [Bryobacteraceae bacterium]
MNAINKNLLVALAFVALGAIAVAGWARQGDAPAGVQAFQPGVYGSNPAAAAAPVDSRSEMEASLDGYPASYGNPCVEPAQVAAPVAYRDLNRPVHVRPAQRVVEEPARREATAEPRSSAAPARRTRSTGKSVAIVAGSAGVGAAIGGLAGGGKGAAIGAISGGSAGYVYDRLTRR